MTTQTPAEALARVEKPLGEVLSWLGREPALYFRGFPHTFEVKEGILLTMYEAEQLKATLARAVEDAEWKPIETAPKDEKVFFWIVPKTLDDGIDVTIFCDTSGKPILSSHKPYWLFCEFNCWGGLSRATHWRPNLTGPAIDTARGVANQEKAP